MHQRQDYVTTMPIQPMKTKCESVTAANDPYLEWRNTQVNLQVALAALSRLLNDPEGAVEHLIINSKHAPAQVLRTRADQ